MDIQFHGANCVTISTKQARVVVDDELVSLGSRSVTKAGDVAVFTGAHGIDQKDARIVIDQPGEYEAAGVAIEGIAARSHIDETGQQNATIYKISVEDIHVLIVGHIYPELTDEQLEMIGTVDLIIVPVGGSGYTLDGIGALEIIKKVKPKLVVPTHYADTSLAFPVPQQTLQQALKELGMDPQETTQKLRLKAGSFDETTIMQLVILERAA